MKLKNWHMRMRDKYIRNLITHDIISLDFVRLERNVADLLIKGLMHTSTTKIWVVEGNEIIAHKLVATMDTHVHMNGDPMEWSSMGNNEVVVD